MRSLLTLVACAVLAGIPSPITQALADGDVIVSHDFNSNGEGWKVYDYDGGVLGGSSVFYPATSENSGGVGDSGYVWGDDSRWRIDTPEDPDSILAFIIYRQWSGEEAVDLRDANLSVYLRGEQLDLKGGNVQFWILNNDLGTRWHYTGAPLAIIEGAWGEKQSIVLDNDESLWHLSWARTSPASLDAVLGATDSYGFSFLEFSEEVTGTFAMDELRIAPEPLTLGVLGIGGFLLLFRRSDGGRNGRK